MSVLDVIQSPAMTTGRCSKPPRVNCAGWCLWCGERDCQQLVCQQRHGVSVWRVCPDCGGCEVQGFDRCGCVSGPVEAVITSARLPHRDTPQCYE